MCINIYICIHADILHLLTCWGSSSSYVYGALNNLQLPGTISDEANGVLDDLQDRGLGGLRAEKEKFQPFQVCQLQRFSLPLLSFCIKDHLPYDLGTWIRRKTLWCSSSHWNLSWHLGSDYGAVCWRNSMNVEALQIAIWGQETLSFLLSNKRSL